MDCLSWDFLHFSESWYDRVPSASNPSDGPSRLKFDWAKGALGASIVQPVLERPSAPCAKG